MTIVVTGVTGVVGGYVARELAALGVPFRMVVRDRRAPDLPAAEVAVASYEDQESLAGALEPGDRGLQWSRCIRPTTAGSSLHRAFIDEAVRRRVGHVVYLSFIGAGERVVQPRSPPWRDGSDAARFGASWSAVRNGMYGDEIASWFDPRWITGSRGGGSASVRPSSARRSPRSSPTRRTTIASASRSRRPTPSASELAATPRIHRRRLPLRAARPRGLDREPALGRTPGVVDRGGDLVLRRRLAWRGGRRQPRLRGADRYACPHRARAARAGPRRSAPSRAAAR